MPLIVGGAVAAVSLLATAESNVTNAKEQGMCMSIRDNTPSDNNEKGANQNFAKNM